MWAGCSRVFCLILGIEPIISQTNVLQARTTCLDIDSLAWEEKLPHVWMWRSNGRCYAPEKDWNLSLIQLFEACHGSIFYDVMIRYRHKIAHLRARITWCAVAYNENNLAREKVSTSDFVYAIQKVLTVYELFVMRICVGPNMRYVCRLLRRILRLVFLGARPHVLGARYYVIPLRSNTSDTHHVWRVWTHRNCG